MFKTTLEQRVKNRIYRRTKYNSDPEFREKQLMWSSNYQKRMWRDSEEFRAKKNFQKKNPLGIRRGRPLKDG